MKIKNCLVASAALVVASCSSTDNTVVTTRPTVVTKPQTQMSGQYLALPGQAAVAVSSDVNSAFDAQVAQYNGQTAAASHMGNAPAYCSIRIPKKRSSEPNKARCTMYG